MLIDAIGYIGLAFVLIAYALITFYGVEKESSLYNGMNLAGAVFLAINVGVLKNWPLLILQCAWGVIACFALVRHSRGIQ